MATTVQIPFLRTAHNYDRNKASEDTGVFCPPAEGKTQQQFKDEADINEIVRRFGLTGQIPGDFRAPIAGDFTDVVDFQTAMNQVLAAEAEFMRMPGELRARFNNDPQRLMDFVSNAANRDEAMKLGLIPQPPAPPAPTGLPGPSPAPSGP